MREDLPRIGRYEVVTRLAIGGMAELFLARERGIAGLERLVVLKRILPHLADKPRFIDMFLREARIVARLAHPNVVQIFDLGEDDGNYYIAMEYIHGSTVRELQVLSRQHRRKFPLDVAVGVLIQSLRGLHAAHDLKDLDGKTLGLVHRDISPHNLMCTTDGTVKLLDFGVAKATEEGLEATHSGHLKGKFAYMSPEQARRQEIDRRSDVFGMGVVAWEMLTGERLFKRDHEVDMMKAVLQETVKPPSSYDDSVPPAIDLVVMRALERDRDVRWANADVMRQELIAAAQSASLDTGPDRIGEWVEQTAGTHLALRRETLQKALEHSLTAGEREDLLHVTGSESGSVDTEIDIDLAVKMTQDAIRDAKERSSSGSGSGSFGGAAVSAETVVDRPRTFPEHETETEGGGRTSPVVLGFAVVALIAVLAIIGGSVFGGEESADAPVLLGEPIGIAWAPTVDPDILRKEIEPLRKYLERSLGRPVTIDVTESYAESSKLLLAGEAPFAVLPPLMYVRTQLKDDRVEPLAIKLFDGAASSDGLLLARGDSPFLKLEDLRGKRFCFTDEDSTTGNFLPRAYIRREGHDPEAFIGEVHWSGDHIQGLRDLLADKCDAAATYSGAFISADQLDIPVGQLRQIAITGNVPQDPIVAGPTVSSTDREAMRRALLSFDPKAEIGADKLGSTQRITAFAAGENAQFDSLREVVKEFQTPLDAGTD